MPPDIRRGTCVLQVACHFCADFYRAAQLLHAVGIRQRIRCHETLTSFHIIIFPWALFLNARSRKPLTRKHNLQLCLWTGCSTKKVVTVIWVLALLPRGSSAPLRMLAVEGLPIHFAFLQNWEFLHSLCTQSWWKILLALQLQKTWDRCQLPALQMRSKLPLISAEFLIGDRIRGRQKGPMCS